MYLRCSRCTRKLLYIRERVPQGPQFPIRIRSSNMKRHSAFSEFSNILERPAKMALTTEIGVNASEPIKSGIVSAGFSTVDLLTTAVYTKPSARVNSRGELQCEPRTTGCWLRAVAMSEDIYSQNCVFELTPDRTVRLRVTKDIRKDDALIAWFSDEVAALIGINFLAPINIKGNNCYTCHICTKSFPSPNPLKLHLSTACERYSRDMLWMRLHYTYQSTASAYLPISIMPNFSPPRPPPLNFATTVLERPPPQLCSKSAAQIETMVSNMGSSKQGHLCIYCGKVYSRKYGLKIHIRTHTGFKPLKCKYCLRPFGDPSNLNKHLRLHIKDESQYKCHICHKMLARRRDLQRHMETKHTFSAMGVTSS